MLVVRINAFIKATKIISIWKKKIVVILVVLVGDYDDHVNDDVCLKFCNGNGKHVAHYRLDKAIISLYHYTFGKYNF